MIWSIVPSPASRCGPVIGAWVSLRAIRGPARARGDAARPQPLQPDRSFAQPRQGAAQWMPCVAEPHGTAQPRVTVAADPHRDLSAPIGSGIRPGRPDVPQMIIGQPSPAFERDPEGGELLPCPAHPHTEDQPAAAQLVQVGRHTGGEQRVPVGSDEYRRAEPDPSGETCEPGQGGERLVEGCRIALGHVGGDGDVVRDHQ